MSDADKKAKPYLNKGVVLATKYTAGLISEQTAVQEAALILDALEKETPEVQKAYSRMYQDMFTKQIKNVGKVPGFLEGAMKKRLIKDVSVAKRQFNLIAKTLGSDTDPRLKALSEEFNKMPDRDDKNADRQWDAMKKVAKLGK